MKSLKLLIAFCLWGIQAASQVVTSQIVDEDGDGIPFAAVGVLGKNFGAITFEDGSFQLDVVDRYLDDTLVVAALGYERLLVPYSSFVSRAPEELALSQQTTKLDEVEITPEGLDYAWIGEKKKSSTSNLSFLNPQDGKSVAVLMNLESELLQLQRIAVSVKKENLERFQLRAMLFEMNEDSLPGAQVLSDNLIQTSEDRKGVLTFELEEPVWIDEPFYVGFEWIVTKAQYEEIVKVQEQFPIDFVEELVSDYSDWKYTINSNSIIQLRDIKGNLQKEIILTKPQREQLKERDKVRPRVLFQINYKRGGLRTVTGSHITNSWRVNRFHALVSVYVGKG